MAKHGLTKDAKRPGWYRIYEIQSEGCDFCKCETSINECGITIKPAPRGAKNGDTVFVKPFGKTEYRDEVPVPTAGYVEELNLVACDTCYCNGTVDKAIKDSQNQGIPTT